MTHDAMIIYADTRSGLAKETLAGALSLAEVSSAPSMAAAREAIITNGSPKYMVIDIGGRTHNVLPDIDALAEICAPTVHVVVTGESNDVSFYRELIKRGILEYFPYPIDLHALTAALSAPLRQASAKPSSAKHNGAVISFFAAASGNGSSTVALNTAYALANVYQQPTVLVDLDYQYGMIARNLSIQANYGIKELFDHPERGIDTSLVNTMAAPYSKFLRVIAAPQPLRLMPAVNPKMIGDLIGALKSEFAFVILDVPHMWNEWTIEVFKQSNHNVLVSELWLRSLTHISRLLPAWREHNLRRESLMLVMNRMGSKYREALSVSEFERVCTLTHSLQIPNDTKAISAAENGGKTVLEIGASETAQAYQQLATHLYTAATGAPPVEVTSKKRGLGQLFGG